LPIFHAVELPQVACAVLAGHDVCISVNGVDCGGQRVVVGLALLGVLKLAVQYKPDAEAEKDNQQNGNSDSEGASVGVFEEVSHWGYLLSFVVYIVAQAQVVVNGNVAQKCPGIVCAFCVLTFGRACGALCVGRVRV